MMQALAILVIGWFAANLAHGLVRRVLARAEAAPVPLGFLSNLSHLVLRAFVAIAAARQGLGVSMPSRKGAAMRSDSSRRIWPGARRCRTLSRRLRARRWASFPFAS